MLASLRRLVLSAAVSAVLVPALFPLHGQGVRRTGISGFQALLEVGDEAIRSGDTTRGLELYRQARRAAFQSGDPVKLDAVLERFSLLRTQGGLLLVRIEELGRIQDRVLDIEQRFARADLAPDTVESTAAYRQMARARGEILRMIDLLEVPTARDAVGSLDTAMDQARRQARLFGQGRGPGEGPWILPLTPAQSRAELARRVRGRISGDDTSVGPTLQLSAERTPSQREELARALRLYYPVQDQMLQREARLLHPESARHFYDELVDAGQAGSAAEVTRKSLDAHEERVLELLAPLHSAATGTSFTRVVSRFAALRRDLRQLQDVVKQRVVEDRQREAGRVLSPDERARIWQALDAMGEYPVDYRKFLQDRRPRLRLDREGLDREILDASAPRPARSEVDGDAGTELDWQDLESTPVE